MMNEAIPPHGRLRMGSQKEQFTIRGRDMRTAEERWGVLVALVMVAGLFVGIAVGVSTEVATDYGVAWSVEGMVIALMQAGAGEVILMLILLAVAALMVIAGISALRLQPTLFVGTQEGIYAIRKQAVWYWPWESCSRDINIIEKGDRGTVIIKLLPGMGMKNNTGNPAAAGWLRMVDIPMPRQIYQWCERRLQQGPGEKSIW